MIRPLALLVLSTALLAPAPAAASSPPVQTNNLQSRLVAEVDAAVPGTRLTLGLLLEHDPHWHTYWRNPGDSGLPTELELVLPDGVVAEPIAWPHPQRFELSQIVNFGYDGRRLLPVTITIPADYAAPTLPVSAKASWLICEEECIPGNAEYAFEVPVAATAAADTRWSGDFAAARADIPRAADVTLSVSEDGDHIVLVLPDSAATPARWRWFPETPNVVANGAGPQWQRAATGWQARWPKSEYFATLPADAVFVAVDEDAAATGDAPPTEVAATLNAPATDNAAAADASAPAAAPASAWRFAGIATASAASPATTTAPPDDKPFGRWPVLLMAVAAALLLTTIAIAIRASLSRRASPPAPEESDR